MEKERGQVQASEGRILYFTEHWQRGGQCQAKPSLSFLGTKRQGGAGRIFVRTDSCQESWEMPTAQV